MNSHHGSTGKPIDVDYVLDEGCWGPYQTKVMWLSGLIVVLDGIDIQLFGIVIPALMKEWKLPVSAFAPVVATGLVGMMAGGAVIGAIGDRLGRRFALICSACIFGIASIALSLAGSLTALAVLRFVGSLGLQGATPNSAALVCECVPRRHRALAVTLLIVCIPLGATLAGLMAIPLLPAIGWRGLFLLGGILPVLVSLFLARMLPESPRYLVHHRARWSELAAVLRLLGRDVPDDAVFVASAETHDAVSFWRVVLAADIRSDTLALWAAFFFCLFAVYASTNWIPAVLTGAGLSLTLANTGIAVFNLGGVVGALCTAFSIALFGSKRTMLTMTAAAIAGTILLAATEISQQRFTASVIVLLGVTGGLISAVQVALYTLATSMYKTAVRATGVGAASSVGRIGAIVSPYAGNWTIALGGSLAFFTLLAAAMLGAFLSVSLIRRHIPAASTGGSLNVSELS